MAYSIGDVLPLERRPGLFGALFTVPWWFVLKTHPVKEPDACSWLGRHGVEAWFPVESVWRRKPGSKRYRILVEKKVAPGYVFALFPGEPYWDRLFEAYPGRLYVRSAVSVGGMPARISNAQVAQMALVPERLRLEKERLEAERLAREAAEAEARRVYAGQKARVIGGAFEGHLVDVTQVGDAMARILTPLFGGLEAEIDVALLRRVEGSPCS